MKILNMAWEITTTRKLIESNRRTMYTLQDQLENGKENDPNFVDGMENLIREKIIIIQALESHLRMLENTANTYLGSRKNHSI